MTTKNHQVTLDEQIDETSQPKTTQQQRDIELQRAGLIMAALDVEQAFKLYSYRIIDHDAFIEKMFEINVQISKLK